MAKEDAVIVDRAGEKKHAPAYLVTSVVNLITVGAGLELQERGVFKSDKREELLVLAARRHAKCFDEGNGGVYTTNFVSEMKQEYKLSAVDALEPWAAKGTLTRRFDESMKVAKNLVPVLYCAPCLDSDKSIKSGKNASDLLVELKRCAYLYNKKDPEKFNSSLPWNEYDKDFLVVLLYGPFIEYFSEEHKMHPIFHPLARGKASEAANTAQAQRAQNVELGRKRRREKDLADKIAFKRAQTASPSFSSASAFSSHASLVEASRLTAQASNFKTLTDNYHRLLTVLPESDPRREQLISKLLSITPESLEPETPASSAKITHDKANEDSFEDVQQDDEN